MPQILKYIDAIAREKQRDVLYVTFHGEDLHDHYDGYYYPESTKRTALMAWLDDNNIPYMECGHFANEHSLVSYLG